MSSSRGGYPVEALAGGGGFACELEVFGEKDEGRRLGLEGVKGKAGLVARKSRIERGGK